MHIGTTSQAGQDMFAHFISGRISSGTFVDLGCNDAKAHSNTASLEHVGWNGLLVDVIPNAAQGRRSPFICCDATSPIGDLFNHYTGLGSFLHYLSVDCDDATFAALKAFPLLATECQSITVEHDRYRVGDGRRNEMREFLSGLGYDLVCADVIAPGYGEFEDWWAHPTWSSKGTRNRIRCANKTWAEMLT